MSEWIVYSKDGNTERCRLKALEYSGTWMGERAVTATFEYHSEVAFEVFDYLEYRGEVFELDAVPTVKKTSSFDYSYDLRFVSKKYELERCEMRDLVPNDNGVVYPTPLTFSFTGDVRYLVERIQACLDALYGEGVWSIVVADGVESEEKNITLAQQNCWNALALVNTTYGLNFYVKGREVVIGGTQPVVSHTFEYGKGNGLYEIERSADTDKGIVTKLRAYGGTRNLDYSYPKQPEWNDSALSVSFALSPLRLMLPSFKADGKTDFVLADDATIAKYGIREASMVYDDIYPTITGATNSSGEAIDEIKSVDAVDDSASTFTVYLYDLGFDLEEHLTTSEAQLSMKSGPLQGYTFNISSIEKQSDGGYKLVLGRNSLEGSEESGFYVPNADWNMSAGDKFVLLNILMPQAYIREAEERLLARAKEYLAQYGKTNFSYNIGLHDKFLVEHGSVYGSLLEGSKLSVRDAEIGIDEDVTIQSITITENMEENILPQVKVTLNNEPSASTLDRIQGKLNDIANETAANNFSSQSELMAQYRKKLDKPFFDKLFVAIDADGNEIASNDVTTPVAYIKALYDVAVVGGVTMYVNDKSLDIPSIYAGIPFDNKTIWLNPETGLVEVLGGTGGGSGEGVSNFWDLSNIPSWITATKPTYSYSEIDGTPDLSVYALSSDLESLQTKIDDFLEGSDTDTIINKWLELESFLSGLAETDNLATILGSKANKATTLAGYGITDAYTKSAVDTLLGNYVTLGTAQTITGEKNFTGGLKVNGSPIVYDATNKYWKLEGDLLVTGGVTMYGNDSEFVASTIMDALLLDDATLGINSEGQLYVKGGTGGGLTEVYWDDVKEKPTFATVATSGKYSDLSGVPTLLSSFTDDVVAGKYLPLSGGTMNGILYFADTTDLTHIVGQGTLVIGAEGSRAVVLTKSYMCPVQAMNKQFNLGASTNYWKDLYLSGGIYSDDTLNIYDKTYIEGDGANILTLKRNNTSGGAFVSYKPMNQDNFGWLAGPNMGYDFTFYYYKDDAVTNEMKAMITPEGNMFTLGNLVVGSVTKADNVVALNVLGKGWLRNGVKLYAADDVINTDGITFSSTVGGVILSRISADNAGRIGVYPSESFLIRPGYADGKSLRGLSVDLKGISEMRCADSALYNLHIIQQTAAYGAWVRYSSNNQTNNTWIGGVDGSYNFRLSYSSDNGNNYVNELQLSNAGLLYAGKGFDTEASSDATGSYRQGGITILRNNGAANGGITLLSGTGGIYVRPNGSIVTTNQTIFPTTGGLRINDAPLATTDKPSLALPFSSYISFGGYHALRGETNAVVLCAPVSASGTVILRPNGNASDKYQFSINDLGEAVLSSESAASLTINRTATTGGAYVRYNAAGQTTYGWISGSSQNHTYLCQYFNGSSYYIKSELDSNGNFLAYGGITMYSDIRKKTKLQDVELSLNQIANAPLIEHYYNSDDKKTTHVGSIAQYWAGLNDWFCKLDNEGYYTMEIQNAALASAISIARHLQKYESKTDRTIRKLKQRVSELEEEMEKLKSA